MNRSRKIVVSGSSGLVGTALVEALEERGDVASRLVRNRHAQGIFWDPAKGEIDFQALAGADAMVHLAGENIAARRWSATQKRRVLRSRVDGTRLLVEGLAQLDHPPRSLICASAIGFYGDRGGEWLNEESEPGEGFLAEVCRAWEEAAMPAEDQGIRLVRLRIGVILSEQGGALEKIALPFKLGAGGRLGDGRQYFSWIALDDLIGIILHLLDSDAVSGAVNAVAPNPVTNQDLTAALGRVLKRPTALAVPKFALRLAAGEMADEMLLASTRVRADKIQESGYDFRYAEVEETLRVLLR